MTQQFYTRISNVKHMVAWADARPPPPQLTVCLASETWKELLCRRSRELFKSCSAAHCKWAGMNKWTTEWTNAAVTDRWHVKAASVSPESSLSLMQLVFSVLCYGILVRVFMVVIVFSLFLIFGGALFCLQYVKWHIWRWKWRKSFGKCLFFCLCPW